MENYRDMTSVPPVVPSGSIPTSKGPKPRDEFRCELRVCASFFFVVLVIVLGTVWFPKVWPGWEQLPSVWPVVLPLIGLLVALSKRSYLRYVRVRQS